MSEGFAEDILTAPQKSDKHEPLEKSYKIKDENWFRLDISHATFSDVDLAVQSVLGKVVKQKSTDKGFVLLTEHNSTIKANVVMKSDESFISCRVSATGEVYVKNKDKVLPWFEKMCSSLVIK